MSDAVVTKRESESPKSNAQFSGGPTANRPSNAPRWLHYFDTDLGHDVVWDGSVWRLGPVGPAGPIGPQGDVSSLDGVEGGVGVGLLGSFYNNMDLAGTPVATQYSNVDLFWIAPELPPIPGLNPEHISARWEGYVQIPVSGDYVFSTYSDDGVRLYVNSILAINNWSHHGTTLDSSPVFNFSAGQQVPLKLEWFQGPEYAVIRLQWAYPGQASTVIPIEVLGA